MKNIPNLLQSTLEECRFNVKSDFEKELEHYRKNMEFYLNPKYNVENILKHMFDEVVDHSQLFFQRDLQTLGIEHFNWDGKNESIKKGKKNIVPNNDQEELPTKII